MKKANGRRPTWILTVAAAYAALPACGDDVSTDPSSDGGVDAAIRDVDAKVPTTLDAGLVARPSDVCVIFTDAGPVVRYLDAGGLTGAPHTQDGVIGFAVRPCVDEAVDASARTVKGS